jgi:HK97 family phage major capsid protein
MASIPQRIGQYAQSVDSHARATEFLQVCRALAAERHSSDQRAFLRRMSAGDRTLQVLEERAAAFAGTTTDSTWGAPLSQFTLASNAFAEGLRTASAFDRVLSDGAFLRVPPMTRVAVISAGASASKVDEGAPKPATALSLTNVELSMSKVSAFVVLSHELMRMAGSGALALLQRELVGALSTMTDGFFITQLLDGLTAIPSSGSGALEARQDLRHLMDAVLLRADSRPYFLTTAQIAKRLTVVGDGVGGRAFPGVTPTGGTLDGVPLLVSDGLSAGLLVLFDAAQVAVSAGAIEVDRSDQTSIQMDTSPDSPPTASSLIQSLWQQNLSALRCERFLAVERMRTTAAASISSFTGIGDSPA